MPLFGEGAACTTGPGFGIALFLIVPLFFFFFFFVFFFWVFFFVFSFLGPLALCLTLIFSSLQTKLFRQSSSDLYLEGFVPFFPFCYVFLETQPLTYANCTLVFSFICPFFSAFSPPPFSFIPLQYFLLTNFPPLRHTQSHISLTWGRVSEKLWRFFLCPFSFFHLPLPPRIKLSVAAALVCFCHNIFFLWARLSKCRSLLTQFYNTH